MLRHFTALAFGLAVAALAMSASNASPDCNRISAAYYKHPYQYFVIRDHVLVVEDRVVEKVIQVSKYKTQSPITAAFALEDHHELYLLSPQEGQVGFHEIGFPAPSATMDNFGDVRARFEEVEEVEFRGMDAASSGPNGRIHYFYGCHYVTADPDFRDDVTGPRPNRELGLPCDVDAAFYWSDVRATTVVKGDQMWIYATRAKRFLGPYPLASYMTAFSQLNLCFFTE